MLVPKFHYWFRMRICMNRRDRCSEVYVLIFNFGHIEKHLDRLYLHFQNLGSQHPGLGHR